MNIVTKGHKNTLILLENEKTDIQRTLQDYKKLLKFPVYLRPTEKGFTVLSLNPKDKSMIGVGGKNTQQHIITSLPINSHFIEKAVTGYNSKASDQKRKSVEESFSTKIISYALQHKLKLPWKSEDLFFIHQEWRFPKKDNVSILRLDMLAVNREGRLVVIEFKKNKEEAIVKNTKKGGDAIEQAKIIANLLFKNKRECYPFFQRLLAAQSHIYNGENFLKSNNFIKMEMPLYRASYPIENSDFGVLIK